MLSNVITNSNSSSATSSNRGGQEYNDGNETTTGSLTAPQQIGSTQIGTPTGFGTYSNQGSVTNANAMSFMSSILSNIMNAGSQASAKKYNSAEAAAERAFEKEMRGTAYQDTVKDMIAAGINPILAASNGATATPSGASASIGTQRYNQQSAQAASVSAMYEYGNNTAELANRYLELAKKATSAKQYHSAKSWNEAASSLAQSSAKQARTAVFKSRNTSEAKESLSTSIRSFRQAQKHTSSFVTSGTTKHGSGKCLSTASLASKNLRKRKPGKVPAILNESLSWMLYHARLSMLSNV